MDRRWICCQLGAREHYAVPRAIHRANLLEGMETDVWTGKGRVLRRLLPRSFGDRYHPELANASIGARNLAAIMMEARLAVGGAAGWSAVLQRNAWFQKDVAASLEANASHGRAACLFSFSYAAREIFAFAKSRGWKTVLGQVDPGPAEDRLVAELHRHSPHLSLNWRPAPKEYWESWRVECELADHIIVNSEWSRDLLTREGVQAHKVCILPLAYDPPPEASSFRRSYPSKFSAQRPLRVLFLGQVNLRKGYAAISEAMELLRAAPVEFLFVGPIQVPVPKDAAVRGSWVGAVPRSRVDHYFRNSDVLLFPTLSDGFGLTQLEAQAWKLPIIASRNCGQVVRHEVNGIILGEVNGAAIAEAISRLVNAPDRLAGMSALSIDLASHSVAALGRKLLALNKD